MKRHRIQLYLLYLIWVLVQVQLAEFAVPRKEKGRYPYLECHPGYDFKKGEATLKENDELCESDKSDTICWKYCIQNAIGITTEDSKLQNSDKVAISIQQGFFTDKKTPTLISDKIVFECTDEYKAIKKRENCANWNDFIDCVDNVWLCKPGVTSVFSTTNSGGKPSTTSTTHSKPNSTSSASKTSNGTKPSDPTKSKSTGSTTKSTAPASNSTGSVKSGGASNSTALPKSTGSSSSPVSPKSAGTSNSTSKSSSSSSATTPPATTKPKYRKKEE